MPAQYFASQFPLGLRPILLRVRELSNLEGTGSSGLSCHHPQDYHHLAAELCNNCFDKFACPCNTLRWKLRYPRGSLPPIHHLACRQLPSAVGQPSLRNHQPDFSHVGEFQAQISFLRFSVAVRIFKLLYSGQFRETLARVLLDAKIISGLVITTGEIIECIEM